MATYLIGDIQGCYDPLQRLLELIDFEPSKDKLWLCGDLVNRGGQSLQVLQFLKQYDKSVSTVLGNHDLHLLASYEKHPQGNSGNREFDEVLDSSDAEELMHWLRRQPLAIWSEKHQMLRVHAGVIPQWDVKDTIRLGQEVSEILQSDQRQAFFSRMYKNKPRLWKEERHGWKRLRLITNILTRMRFCDDMGRGLYHISGPPGCQPQHYKPLYKHKHRKTRDVTVVFGHWAALGVRIRKRYISMDSGCVWGGKLSALRLGDRRLFKVKCKKQ
jgi:bis(5'-nucleosyl)-tetraphosphatase (symmetrical)